MKEYWTIKAIGEFGQCVGILAHEGDFFEKVSGLRPIRRFASMVLAANEVTRWRGMKHCGLGKSPSYKLVRHTIKTKPRGAKVGTWAWACEQMLAGKKVIRSSWSGPIAPYYMGPDRYSVSYSEYRILWKPYDGPEGKPPIYKCDMLGTDWQVAP